MNIDELTVKEANRQQYSLNLIASENYPSREVISLLGSVWQNKYGEGSPGKRYYSGCEYIDELESYVADLALKIFDTTGEYYCNSQALSGTHANQLVFFSLLKPGDTVMHLALDQGGHLSHMHSTSPLLQFFHAVHYRTKKMPEKGYTIDFDDYQLQLSIHKPKLVIIGFSAYPQKYEFRKFIEYAHETGSMVLADIAHIAGIIAAGKHDTPFQTANLGADFITMTTHKTLRGPRGALLFCKMEHKEKLMKTIFPGMTGGPHFHQIAAIGRALEEVIGVEKHSSGVDFRTYIQLVLDTNAALEKGLAKNGIYPTSPTETHLSLLELPKDSDTLEIQIQLERAGVLTNRNTIPYDKKTAWRPSGMRFGTAALTSRGLTTKQAEELGTLLSHAIVHGEYQSLKDYATSLVPELSWWYD